MYFADESVITDKSTIVLIVFLFFFFNSLFIDACFINLPVKFLFFSVVIDRIGFQFL